jgi:hypothetical protein
MFNVLVEHKDCNRIYYTLSNLELCKKDDFFIISMNNIIKRKKNEENER